MAKAERKLNPAAWGWLLIAGLAAFELLAQPLIHAAVPSDGSWSDAAAFVRERFEPGDRIVAAPSWVAPIVREQLGDLTSLETAAPAGLGGIRRVWELGIRGKSSRDDAAELEESFGEVRVRRWSVPSREPVYDFVEELERARVSVATSQGERACPWSRARTTPGGLGHGPMAPARRFVCDPDRPWLWVGASVLTDLELEPRRCVYQHPAGVDPVRVRFEDVPLGTALLLGAGLDYEHERWLQYAPVRLRVWVDEELVGELVHQDGDGWTRLELDTGKLGKERADVRFETTSENPRARNFCWSARSVR